MLPIASAKNATIPTIKWNTRLCILILFFILLQLFTGLFTDGFILDTDESIWQYIGRNWFQYGLTPYHGGIDNKSPLIFSIFGLSDRLFGIHIIFTRILGILCQSLGLFYVYKIGTRLQGYRTGLIAFLLYGFSMLWKCTGGKFVSHTESFEVLFLILSFNYLLNSNKKSVVFSGIFFGLALGFRMSALVAIPALLYLLIKKNKSYILLFTLGLAGTIISIILVLEMAGIHIRDLIFYTIEANVGFGSTSDHTALWRLENFLTTFFYDEMILFYPGLIGYFFIKEKKAFLLLWLICVFAYINLIGNYNREQLKEILPSLCLLNALSIDYFIRKYSISFRPVLIIICICFFPKVLEPFVALKKLFFPKSNYINDGYVEESSKMKVGNWIKANTRINEKVLVYGYEAQVQLYSERLSPTVYFNLTLTPYAVKRFKEDLNRESPELIVIPPIIAKGSGNEADLRSFVNELIMKKYRLEKNVYGYSIYRLNSNTNFK